MRRPLAPALALALLLPLVAGCAGDEPTVALLVADGSDASHVVDVETFEERVAATCDECSVTVYDAEGDAAQQKSQARQAEAESADVIVVVPVEPEDMESLTGTDVPLVSLGTLVPGAESHVGLRQAADAQGDADSDLAAARDLILGERSSMTYVPTEAMSEQAADVAVALLADTAVLDGPVEVEEDEGVQSWLFEAQDVTLDTLTTLLVGQGVLTLDELCEGETAKKCAKLGFV